MKKIVWSVFAVLFLICSANLSLAQAPIGTGANVLACVNYNDGPGSSDMTLVVQLEVDGTLAINEGHEVAYAIFLPTDQAKNDAIGPSWIEPEYNDSAWDRGLSGVGFADGDDNTEVPSGLLAIYTRYLFQVANSRSVASIILRSDYDDGYACWLNGSEIARSANLNGLELTWDTSTGGIANHGSTELAKGTPNPARQYQEEIDVDFTPVDIVAVEPAGKLATTWAKVKANY